MVAVTATLCLGLAEGMVRILWSRNFPRQPATRTFDPDVGIVHVPGQYRLPFTGCLWGQPECDRVSVKFTINSQGFRSVRDFAAPGGRPLIAVLGDSMIEAAQVDDDKTACSVLEERLRQRFPGVEVRNLGMNGAGFVHYHARWRKFVAAMRPDVLVIAALGLNDFRDSSTTLRHFLAMQPHYYMSSDGVREVRFERPPRPHSRLRRFLARLYEPLEIVRFLRWLKAAREEGGVTVSGNGYPADGHIHIYEDPLQPPFAEAVRIGQEYLERLVHEARAAGSQVIVVYTPWRAEGIDAEWAALATRYRPDRPDRRLLRSQPEDIVRAAAERAGARSASFTDVVRRLPSDAQQQVWHVRTDNHFTEGGNRLFGETLASVIADVLRK